MNFTDRIQADENTDLHADTLSVQKPSPWPIALRVTSAAFFLTLVFCYAFPNG
ncbi:hypothetical protein [Stappia sp. 28M-7]|jgi:hypothetical protein|uniref:hypothetical protein n=1 Tax=Stappia sp. 28M-7 TaxID=2762596 RepID=UPI000FF24DE1|nr:hypothetical protein [Stappia sp. 28M-7]MBC2860581.1 hypothetical protein [Stappia sp. 28M-7]